MILVGHVAHHKCFIIIKAYQFFSTYHGIVGDTSRLPILINGHWTVRESQSLDTWIVPITVPSNHWTSGYPSRSSACPPSASSPAPPVTWPRSPPAVSPPLPSAAGQPGTTAAPGAVLLSRRPVCPPLLSHSLSSPLVQGCAHRPHGVCLRRRLTRPAYLHDRQLLEAGRAGRAVGPHSRRCQNGFRCPPPLRPSPGPSDPWWGISAVSQTRLEDGKPVPPPPARPPRWTRGAAPYREGGPFVERCGTWQPVDLSKQVPTDRGNRHGYRASQWIGKIEHEKTSGLHFRFVLISGSLDQSQTPSIMRNYESLANRMF